MNIYLQNEGELLMDHLLHIGVYKGCTDNIYTLSSEVQSIHKTFFPG